MKNKKAVIISLISLVVVLLLGAGIVLFLELGKGEKTAEETASSKYTTFAELTQTQKFKNVPALVAERLFYRAFGVIIEKNS